MPLIIALIIVSVAYLTFHGIFGRGNKLAYNIR